MFRRNLLCSHCVNVSYKASTQRLRSLIKHALILRGDIDDIICVFVHPICA
jgi:hypothetical protein